MYQSLFSFVFRIMVVMVASFVDIAADEENAALKDQTTKNLESAFAGECEATKKYQIFAEIADKEGFPAVARLWRAASAAEAIHAKNHMKVLGMLKSTEENLRSAVTGEQYEFQNMYPEYIKTAKEAGNQAAATSMEYAFKVEQIHHQMFKEDLKDLEEHKKPELVTYWVCGVCGNTVSKTPPEVCPICKSPKSSFIEIQ